jgi:type 2 lantibiotic biosynthesis protein LanM
MVGSVDTPAQVWARRWQRAVAQAMGPAREVTLTLGELMRTGEHGMFSDPGGHPNDVVVLDDKPTLEDDPVPRIPPLTLPPSESDVNVWLKSLAARASVLQERCDTTRMIPVLSENDRLVQDRLARWANLVAADGASGIFEHYLRWEGFDEPAARRAVGPVRLTDDAGLPDWVMTLREALFEACDTALPGVCVPERPIPFESLLLPFVHIYLQRVHTEVPTHQRLLSPAAEHLMARHLLKVLSTIARDVLFAEFCRYRLADFAPLARLVSSEPDTLYWRFVEHMCAGGFATMCQGYPVLARRLAMQTDLFAAAVSEFLCRLAADRAAICELWEVAELGPVQEMRAGLSDPHCGVRQVFAMTFADGLQLVYKPKDMGIDIAYNGLVKWLNAAGTPITLRPLCVLDRHTHGWVEYVKPAACADRDAVVYYYQRAGALTCLIYLLQGSDCHGENLIADGANPVLVDCETLLNSWPRAADAHAAGDRRRGTLNHLMRDTVLTTGLLPSLGDGGKRTFSAPGFCRMIMLRADKVTNRWMFINTDDMFVSQVAIRSTDAHNLPHIDGIPAEVGENIEALIAGFVAMYRFLMAQRPALLVPSGPLAVFRGLFVRFVFRATHLYSVLSGLAMRPIALSDGVDHSLSFELLARVFLVSNQNSAAWPILASEREALLRGDVPFFGAYTDQTALLLENGERIEDYFDCPSYDAMLTKLRNLNEQDLEFQVGLIRAAIAVYADLQAREVTAIAATHT